MNNLAFHGHRPKSKIEIQGFLK